MDDGIARRCWIAKIRHQMKIFVQISVKRRQYFLLLEANSGIL
jgi:hypothetical protein